MKVYWKNEVQEYIGGLKWTEFNPVLYTGQLRRFVKYGFLDLPSSEFVVCTKEQYFFLFRII